MSVSCRQFILPLGCLVILSGCSGGRLRQNFGPDREFMQLSELEDYDALHGEIHGPERKSKQSLVSLSRDRTDEESHRGMNLLNPFRWFGQETDEVPADPFLADDEVAPVVKSEAADDKNDVIVIGSSRELPDDRAETLLDDIAAFDSPAAASTDPSTPASDTRMSFSDIMAEFDDVDENPDEEFEKMAAQFAGDTNVEASDSGFDALLAATSDEADRFELSMDMLEDGAPSREEEVPSLNLADDQPSSFSFDDEVKSAAALSAAEESVPDLPSDLDDFPSLSFDETADPLVVQSDDADDTDAGPAFRLPETSDSRATLTDDTTLQDTMWESADSQTTWSDTTNEVTATIPVVTAATAQPLSLPVAQAPQPPLTFESAGSGSLPGSAAATSEVSQPGTPVAAMTVSPAPEARFSSEPFLQDFQAESAPPAPAPPTGTVVHAAQSGSIKAWIMLLGGVVILYLLFAPERKIRPEPHNA